MTCMRNEGFGLIETLVSLGIMGIVSLALVALATQMQLSQNGNDFRLSNNVLATTLANGNITGTLDNISITTPATTFTSNQILSEYKLTISKLQYNYSLVQTNWDGSQVYYGSVKVSTIANQKMLGNPFGNKLVANEYVTVVGGNIVGSSPSMPVVAPSPVPVAQPVLNFCINHHGEMDEHSHICRDMRD